MNVFNRVCCVVLGIGLVCGSLSCFAEDQVAKEDVTLPAAEGPLTVEQIPVITTLGKPVFAPVPGEKQEVPGK